MEWSGGAHVSSTNNESANIGRAVARDLIENFRDPDFWALCEIYKRANPGESTVVFTVHLGKGTKIVSNYANSAPEWTTELEDDVDDAADTHRWRHGDPAAEPLVHIEDDARMPKPGVTPLMRAAASENIEKLKELLEAGADVGQPDSSGWTALMYAIPRECGGGDSACMSSPNFLKTLLAAGADANYSSPHGYTPLMAAAFDRRFEKELVKAGANINAQNVDGISALMILASFGKVDEIKAALDAGADPKLRDNQGRTALEYLRLANCDRSPLRDPLQDSAQVSSDCKSLEEGDFEQTKALLQKAVAAP